MHPQTFGSPEEDEGGGAMMAAYRHWVGDTVLGAFGEGGLIGVAGFYVARYKKSQHRGHIFSVIKVLLARAEARVEQVHLAVGSTATAAIKTYKRNGFEIYGMDPGVIRVGDTSYDHYLMMKKFSR